MSEAKASTQVLEAWKARLQRFYAGSVTVTEFCATAGFSLPSFYQWQRRIKSLDPNFVPPDRRRRKHPRANQSREQSRSAPKTRKTGLIPVSMTAKAADMRKVIDGLSGIVRGEFNADPTDGSLFVFVNRQRDRMKLLHFEGGGFWLYYRVLEAGTFESLPTRTDSNPHPIDATQLTMWLSGISLVAAQKRRKRFVLPREKIVA